jgi:hypothetical protein
MLRSALLAKRREKKKGRLVGRGVLKILKLSHTRHHPLTYHSNQQHNPTAAPNLQTEDTGQLQ